jgi:hypothetical protein
MVVFEPRQQVPCPPLLPAAGEQITLAQPGDSFQARLERQRPMRSVRIRTGAMKTRVEPILQEDVR